MNLWTATVTLFLLLDPVGNIPVFHELLAKYTARERLRIILREMLVALLLLMILLHAGHYLLEFLGLKPATLGIAGGVILFLIAMRMGMILVMLAIQMLLDGVADYLNL